MGKFYDIDPETCSIEELKNDIEKVKAKVELANTQQLSAKLFLNSVYGVFGTAFFNLFNEDIAESITLQGQDLIKFSVEEINKYFAELWNKDTDAHFLVAKEMKEKHPMFDVETFLKYASTNRPQFSTLQRYGDTDSIFSDSIIKTKYNPLGVTIEELYNQNKDNISDTTSAGHESVTTDDEVLNWSDCKGLYNGKIKRIIKHKVTKLKWKLRTKTGKEIVCTADHSLVVFRGGKQVTVKPSEVLKTDKVLTIAK